MHLILNRRHFVKKAHSRQRLHNMFCGILSQSLITRICDEAVPAGHSGIIMQHVPEIHQPKRLRLSRITDTLGEGLCKAGIERMWTWLKASGAEQKIYILRLISVDNHHSSITYLSRRSRLNPVRQEQRCQTRVTTGAEVGPVRYPNGEDHKTFTTALYISSTAR